MCVCHVEADELGAIFLFIVNKQSCSPPFVSHDRETLKSRNPPALNLLNDEKRRKKNESILRCSRVLQANPLLYIDNVSTHVYACECCVNAFVRCLHAVACSFLARPCACEYTKACVRTMHMVFVDGQSNIHRVCIECPFSSRIL